MRPRTKKVLALADAMDDDADMAEANKRTCCADLAKAHADAVRALVPGIVVEERAVKV